MGDMLKGKVAVITGAGGGIGSNEALLMAGHGAKVVVNDVGITHDSDSPHESADRVVTEIKRHGGVAVANYDSVGTPEGAQHIIKTAVDNFGGVDILVNNAGAFRIGPIEDMTPEDWDFVMKSHLYGTFYCTKYAVPYMKKKSWGRIINTASHVGFGQANRIAYSAAKEGIVGFSRSIARELGSFGITCNVIRPIAQLRIAGKLGEPMSANQPRDVAAFVTYLASGPADHINCCVFEVWHGHVGIFTDPTPVEKVIWKDGEWTPEEFVKAVPETLTAEREREKYPVSLPLWLERQIKANHITDDDMKPKKK
jgi:NAD(P)-dependent dehydrogenase (short-subunit alcohol dehydrogenase family)